MAVFQGGPFHAGGFPMPEPARQGQTYLDALGCERVTVGMLETPGGDRRTEVRGGVWLDWPQASAVYVFDREWTERHGWTMTPGGLRRCYVWSFDRPWTARLHHNDAGA